MQTYASVVFAGKELRLLYESLKQHLILKTIMHKNHNTY